MTKIVLDAEAFKALASDTRLQILKALDARPLTVSELSRLLDLNKATVFEHLKQLMAAELAKREEDPARKWVYYKLTWKGQNVLHPENAQIFLMLGLAAAGLGGAVLQTAYLAQNWLAARSLGSSSESQPEMQKLTGDEDSMRDMGDAAPAQGSADDASTTQSGSTTAASGTASEPSGMGAGASGSSTSPNDTEMEMAYDSRLLNEGGEGGDSAASAPETHWYDPILSNEFLTLAGILVFLGLLALIVWTLYGAQRQERNALRGRIDALPGDVNTEESVV